jgi:hypothetical protein
METAAIRRASRAVFDQRTCATKAAALQDRRPCSQSSHQQAGMHAVSESFFLDEQRGMLFSSVLFTCLRSEHCGTGIDG